MVLTRPAHVAMPHCQLSWRMWFHIHPPSNDKKHIYSNDPRHKDQVYPTDWSDQGSLHLPLPTNAWIYYLGDSWLHRHLNLNISRTHHLPLIPAPSVVSSPGKYNLPTQLRQPETRTPSVPSSLAVTHLTFLWFFFFLQCLTSSFILHFTWGFHFWYQIFSMYLFFERAFFQQSLLNFFFFSFFFFFLR